MISYLKSLTLKQRANGILGLTAVLYCFAFVGQFSLAMKVGINRCTGLFNLPSSAVWPTGLL